MPAKGAAQTLPRAIESVVAQTFIAWELIVAEDGGADGTLEVAQAWAARDSRVRVLPGARSLGPAGARNRALAAARGRYIAFLDADDAWAPEKLTRQIAFMETTGAGLSYTGFWRQVGARRREVRVPASRTRAQLLRGNAIGCLTAVYDTAQLGAVPMPALRHGEDYALWLALLERLPRAHGLCAPLATYHMQPTSHSAHKGRALANLWGMYRRHLKLGRLRSAWYLAHHVAGRIGRG